MLLNIDDYFQNVRVDNLDFFFNSQWEADGGDPNFKANVFFEVR